MKGIIQPLKINFKNSSLELFKIFLIYLLLDLIIRIYEYVITSPYFIEGEIFNLQLRGFYQDNFKFITLLFMFFPLFFIIRLFASKFIYFIVSFIVLFYIIISFVATQYYIVSFIPLDQSFYTYSIDDIIKIMNSSSDLGWTSYIVLAIIILLYFILQKIITLKTKYQLIAIWILWLIAMPNITYSHVKAKFFSNIQNYYLVKNKGLFFIEESFRYFKNSNDIDEELVSIKELAEDYANLYPNNNYVLPEYPLMHKSNDIDVLGKYMNKNDSLPNFVFLLLEGMGRNICGPNARYGSFTPFLDSLINHSLYWENFLSTAERTYGVIPNVLGSLPLGNGGFHYHGDNAIPSNKTLISYLGEKGYRTGFYYGGWTHFQKMDDVLNSSNIDFILGKFDSTAVKIKSDKDGFSWGYDDESMFNQYFKVINSDTVTKKRRLDILLTLSLHSPFMPPNRDYYGAIVDKISKKLSNKTQKKIKPFKNVLSTVVYVDDAIRGFFNNYKKRKDFNNTIFIIVADHNIHAFPDDNEIRRYHIPLIIYSPLIKNGAKFSSVNSHREIAPSILSYLQNNYDVKFDEFIHMIGNSLDDSKEFVANKTLSLFKGSGENISILDKEYFITDGKYYKLKNNMLLERMEVDSIKSILDKKLKIIKDINKYVYTKNKIIPPKFLMKVKK